MLLRVLVPVVSSFIRQRRKQDRDALARTEEAVQAALDEVKQSRVRFRSASAAAMQDIHIQQRNGIVEITLPCLLPKRRQARSTEYLTDPLTAALEQYVKSHVVKRFRHCVVCFAHIYCRDLPDRRIRDYDNLEIKQYLDAAAAWLLTDDGGLLCDVHHTTELGDADCTRMFIMEKPRFPAWLEGRGAAVEDASPG